MSALPRSLRRFSELLEVFDESVTVPLAEMSRRLAALIGPLSAPITEGEGEPEGYSGLSRRGPYERLLLTEWLLADEAPDEFLRRAVTHEHAFYRLSRRANIGSRRSLVLFDAGPSQLGGPRVVQLAALLLLAARAAEAKVDFAFGVLQSDAENLRGSLDGPGLRGFLSARTVCEPTAEDVERWLEHLGPLQREDDVWVISGRRLMGNVGGLSHLVLDEVVAPGERSITAALADGLGREGRSVALDLPAPVVCRQLLTRPLRRGRSGAAPTRDPTVDVRAGLWFSPSGRKLLARRRDGRVLAISVPRFAMEKRPKVTDHWPRDGDRGLTPVAVGWRRKRPIIVRAGEGRLVIEGQFGPKERRVPYHDLPLPSVLDCGGADAPLGQAIYANVGAGGVGILFFVHHGSVDVRLSGALVDEADGCLIRPMLSRPVVALQTKAQRMVAVAEGEQEDLELWTWGNEEQTQRFCVHPTVGRPRQAALCAFGGDWRYGQLVAPRTATTLRRYTGPGLATTEDLVFDPAMRLVGALPNPNDGARASPVLMSSSGDLLHVLGGPFAGDHAFDEHPPGGPVVMSPEEPIGAWVTSEGDLVVYDFKLGDLRVRLEID